MGPKPTDKGPCESIVEGRHKKEGHVKMEQRVESFSWEQGRHKKMEEAKKDSPWETLLGQECAANTLISDFFPPEV